MTSFNRNFTGRNDGNPNTHAFVASPDLVTAQAFAGSIDFDPVNDSLKGADGKEFRFRPPTGDTLPRTGFSSGEDTFQKPLEDGADVKVGHALEREKKA